MAQVTIERLGHLGDGIANGPVFAARTLPGEVIEGEVTGDRLTDPRIVTPSSNRVAAPCRHYRTCGGCGLQHASDDFVQTWKVDVVRAALAAQGITTDVRRVHTSPPGTRRRAVFSGRKTKKGALVGFHAPASDVITPVPDCHVVSPAVLAALPALEHMTILGGSRKGEVRFAVTETETGLDVSVTGGKEPDLGMRQSLAAMTGQQDLARLTWNGEPIAQNRAPVLTFGTAPVPVPPGAFLQATKPGEAALQACVIEAIGSAASVCDLFSGCGTFALHVTQQAEVHAVESDQALIEASEAGWRFATGARRLTTERRDLFRRPLMPDELKSFGAVVIDPPRAGAEAQMAEIAQAAVPRVASVSCNPVTFARDTRLLIDAGYVLDWLDVVDQFRWSPHVEIAAAFRLNDM